MKKLIAIFLTAVLALSFAACSDKDEDDEDYTLDESETEVSEKSKLPDVDIDPDVKKLFEEKMDVSKLGPLTTYALQQLEGKDLQLEFTIQNLKDDDEKSSKKESSKKESSKEESSKKSSFDFSSLSGDIDIILTKNANKDIRFNFGMSLFSFDVLKNKDGIFSMNTRKKTYQVLQTAEEVKKAESEASSDSSGQASRIKENIKKNVGDMFGDDVDIDELFDTDVTSEIKSMESGKAEYKNKDYKMESYTITETKEVKKKSESKSESKAEETKKETTTSKMICYFDDDDLLRIIHIESEKEKYDIIINVLSNEIDKDELIIPDNYKEKEASKISLKDISGLEDLKLDD